MRCTRCDRPTVPQAVGLTPEGVLAFGWCLACLRAAGCDPIAVARPSRRPTTRLVLARPLPRPARPAPPFSPLDERRTLVAAVALVLALWGLVLMTVGLILWALGLPRVPSRMGNGTPALLIGGGGTTAAVGLTLWVLNTRNDPTGSRPALRVIQAVGFVAALGTLLAGIVFRSPHRDPLVVGVASAALTVSAAARWIERRRSQALVP